MIGLVENREAEEADSLLVAERKRSEIQSIHQQNLYCAPYKIWTAVLKQCKNIK